MGQFIVSARKYRPNSFETLIGQENIAKTLKNSILRDQLAHAYLFCGPRGVGKTSTARIFAKTINCSNPGSDMEPCGECESCRSFAEGRSYSIHELDAASNNSVEDIRALTEKVRIPPQIGKYSVYIIDEVHMLSQAAFNAFLKTLEEPPAHAIFILATTEKHKILPTILSRCQTYDFNRITIEDIVKNLKGIAAAESINMSEDAMHIIAQKADGAMRDALTLFDQTVAFCGNDITYEQVIKNLNVLDYEYYFKLSDNFLSGDYASAMLTFDEILSKGFNALHFISGLSSHFRDLLVCKNEASQTLVNLAPTIVAKYRQYAPKFSVNFLFEALNCTSTCEAAYKQSGNPRLLIEFALMKLSRLNITADQARVAVQAPAPVSAATVPQPTPQQPVSQQPTPQQPAPQEPAPQEPASPKTEAASLHSILSIKDMMKKASEVKTSDASQSAQTASVALTEENIKPVWSELAKSEEGLPRLASAIAQTSPVIDIENKTIIFKVSNVAQKDWIDKNCRVRLENFIQQKLGDRSVRLLIEVLAVEVIDNEKKLYMPSQKADYLKETSAEFRELSKDLDLETA